MRAVLTRKHRFSTCWRWLAQPMSSSRLTISKKSQTRRPTSLTSSMSPIRASASSSLPY